MLNDFFKPDYIFNKLNLNTFGIIDVRHPFEYNRAHFPNSINTYISSPKEIFKFGESKNNIFKIIEETTSNLDKISRNSSGKKFILLSNNNGIKEKYLHDYLIRKDICVLRIDGGYRALLKYIKSADYSNLKLKILAGYSGSGKSRKLSELENTGHQVINLSKLAGHRGSSFGKLTRNQTSQEQFNINLFLHTLSLDTSKPVYIELEPDHLGSISIPSSIIDLYYNSEVIWINKSKETRINEIVSEYGNTPIEMLLQSLKRLQKSFSSDIYKEIETSIIEMDYYSAADKLLDYYDSSYNELFKKYKIKL